MTTPIGLFYGTNTGYTELVVKMIEEEFALVAPNLITCFDIGSVPLTRLLDFDDLIIACPTWNVGQLQDDWDVAYDKLESLNLTGKKVAMLGLGDQFGYPENFCDAIGIIGTKLAEQGAILVGFTSADGYQFDHSLGVENGYFMGLALDEEHESDKSPERITDWVWQLVDEFDLVDLLDPVN